MFAAVPYLLITCVISFAIAMICLVLQRRLPGRKGLFQFQLFYWLCGVQYLTLVIHQYYIYASIDLTTDLCVALSHFFLVIGALRHVGAERHGRWLLVPAIGVFVFDQLAPPEVLWAAFFYAAGCLLMASLVFLLRRNDNWGESAIAYTLAFWAALSIALGLYSFGGITAGKVQSLVISFAAIPPVVAISGVFLVTSHLIEVQKLVEQDAYKSVFENTEIAIVQTDESGEVLLANGAAKDLFRHSLPDRERHLLQSFVQLQQPLRDNPNHITRAEVERGDTKIPVEIHWVEVRGRLQWQFRDLTQDELLQERDRETVKVEAMRLLAGAVSHDLRNVFSAFTYISEYLKDSSHGSESSEVAEALDGFDQALEHGESLLNRLSGMSSGKELHERIVPVDVGEVVRLVAKSYESGHQGLKIERHQEGGIPLALANSDILIRMLFNLCENAIHAMRDRKQALLQIGLQLNDTRDRIELYLQDNGCGISDDALPRIFEPYFSTKEHGTGLGLFSVQQMVSAVGGTIEVETKKGRGTRFSILLKPASTTPPAPHVDLPEGFRVLVVDDNELSCRLLAATLEKCGCITDKATCPLSAIELLRSRNYDSMVTDFDMKPIDGVALTAEAKRLQPELLVILATGYADVLREHPRLASGSFASILTKPVDSHDLVNALAGRHLNMLQM